MSNKAFFNFNKLKGYSQIYVGFSGGLDSTVLLHALSSVPALKEKMTALHLNHNLNEQSMQWQLHCQITCRSLDIPFYAECLSALKINKQSNIEEQAREARYHFFKKHIKADDVLVLAHHQQDQAETVLFRLLNGAGPTGLSAMREISSRDSLTIVRPLLDVKKQTLIDYAAQYDLNWIEDPSNLTDGFDRNFIRNQIMPLLRNRFGNIDSSFCRTALLCQQQQDHIETTLNPTYEKLLINKYQLSDPTTKHLTSPEIQLLLRYWLKNLNIPSPSFKKLTQFTRHLTNASKDKHPLLSWHHHRIQRYKTYLYYYVETTEAKPKAFEWHDFKMPISIPGKQNKLYLSKVSQNKTNIFIPKGARVTIRFREGGELIKIAGMHKKVKKILQTLNVPPWERANMPLLYINEKLASIAELCISDEFNQPPLNNYLLSNLNST